MIDWRTRTNRYEVYALAPWLYLQYYTFFARSVSEATHCCEVRLTRSFISPSVHRPRTSQNIPTADSKHLQMKAYLSTCFNATVLAI